MKITKDDIAKEVFKKYFQNLLVNHPILENIPGSRSVAMLLAQYSWEDVFDMIVSLERKAYKRAYAQLKRDKGPNDPA